MVQVSLLRPRELLDSSAIVAATFAIRSSVNTLFSTTRIVRSSNNTPYTVGAVVKSSTGASFNPV